MTDEDDPIEVARVRAHDAAGDAITDEALANIVAGLENAYGGDLSARGDGTWITFYASPEEPRQAVPYVAIGAGEKAPWEDLSLNCPECGEAPAPRVEQASGLSHIHHCGKSWMRGPVTLGR